MRRLTRIRGLAAATRSRGFRSRRGRAAGRHGCRDPRHCARGLAVRHGESGSADPDQHRCRRVRVSLVAATLIVALMAYLAATGRPDLETSLRFRFCDENAPVLQTDAPQEPDGQVQISDTGRQMRRRTAQPQPLAARNPGIRIVLEGLGGLPEQAGWSTLAWPNMIGPTIFEWDGGADYIIHGKWSRTLPQLNFDGAFVYPTERGPRLSRSLLPTDLSQGTADAHHHPGQGSVLGLVRSPRRAVGGVADNRRARAMKLLADAVVPRLVPARPAALSLAGHGQVSPATVTCGPGWGVVTRRP